MPSDLPPDLPVPGCGNGIQEPPESCDDGNTVDGDGCEGDCTYPSYTGEALFAGPESTCVRFEDEGVRCWGDAPSTTPPVEGAPPERYGDDEPAALAPEQPLPEPVKQMALSRKGGCGVMASGAVRCFGSYFLDIWPQHLDAVLGQGTPEVEESARNFADAYVVALPGPARKVAMSPLHVCAVLESGELYCWGWNADGQLGLGHTEVVGDDETPMEAGPVDVGGKVVDVATGHWSFHTCVLLEDGAVRCFGAQHLNRLECGFMSPPEDCPMVYSLGEDVAENIGDDEVPASVPPLELGAPAVDVDVSWDATCALREDGVLVCWGGAAAPRPDGGVPVDDGIPSGWSIPTAVPPTKVSWGQGGGLCLWGEASGEVWCNGDVFSALDLWPDGAWSEAFAIHEIWGQGVRDVAAGSAHICFLLDDRSIRCIGLNELGQLGYGDVPEDAPPYACSYWCGGTYPVEPVPTQCCKGDDELLWELPPVPYE